MGSGIKYSAEFRADVVRMVVETSRPIREIAEQAGVKPDTVRTWCSRAGQEGLPMTGPKPTYEQLENEVSALRADLKARDKELADQKKRVEFLGKAASFFAAESYDHQNGSK